ncbi:MAG: restriction endonuclease subunit S [Candidatus Delongbacteria bacterium]|nr:restriction endonuclease subunit S [Candidatus Delongbacteria bacterium]
MQKIFSQEIRFKDDNGNDYPDWEKKKLGDVCDQPMYGMNSAAIEFDGIHKYIRITDIDEGTRTYKPNPLTSPNGNIEEKYKLKEGDILFTRTGASVGKSYLYDKFEGDLYFAGFLIKFSVTKANPYFVYVQTTLKEYDKWVLLMSMRSGQPGINSKEYSLLNVKLPCLEEQKKIAEFLTNLDKKIEIIDTELNAVKEFKKGLLQTMFV